MPLRWVNVASVGCWVYGWIFRILIASRNQFCSGELRLYRIFVSRPSFNLSVYCSENLLLPLQCECASTTSWSSYNQKATLAHQDTTFEVRDCNRAQSQAMGCSNVGIVTLVFTSAKRQRMNGAAQRRPSFLSSQQPGALSASRFMRMLAKWHWDLHLSSPGTIPLALRMFCKVSRALAPAVLSNLGMRVTLAACLRLAAGLDEAQIAVPEASEVAACAGVSTRRLTKTEIHLLALLGWRRFPMVGVRTWTITTTSGIDRLHHLLWYPYYISKARGCRKALLQFVFSGWLWREDWSVAQLSSKPNSNIMWKLLG